MIEVEVRSVSAEDAAPSTVVGMIAWLQAALADIPAEFRETATFEYYSDPTYLRVAYERPATAEEEAVWEAERAARHAAWVEANPEAARNRAQRQKAWDEALPPELRSGSVEVIAVGDKP